MSLIGYARVSTTMQDPTLQHDALTEVGCERIFTDQATGRTQDRPQLKAVMDYLRSGDTLVVWKLDRLGRSLRDLIDTLAALEERGITFRSVTEGIDTSTPAGRMVAGIFGTLAEFERELILERTHAGLAAARARGRVGGRPSVMTPDRLAAAERMRAEGKTLDAIASTLGVGRSTIVRALGRR